MSNALGLQPVYGFNGFSVQNDAHHASGRKVTFGPKPIAKNSTVKLPLLALEEITISLLSF